MVFRWLVLSAGLMMLATTDGGVHAQSDSVDAQSRQESYTRLMNEVSQLGKKLSSLNEDSDEREHVRAAIRRSLTQAFDLRQQLQRDQVAAARAELNEVEKRIDERDRFRDQIVRRKEEDLLAAGSLQWPQGGQDANRSKAHENVIKAGDVVAVYIEGVLPFNPPNQPPVPPPITKLDSGSVVTGYPIVVTSDGTIQLPLLPPIVVQGMSIRQAEKKVAEAYVSNDILRPEKARPMMTLVPSNRKVDSILGFPAIEPPALPATGASGASTPARR